MAIKNSNGLNLQKIRILSQIKNLICIVFVFAMIVLPFKIFAIGQTTDPIVIKNAVRGNEYQKTMTVINTEKVNVKISFSAEGQIGKWAKFYKPDNYKTPLVNLDMAPGETRNANVVFTVPPDTPNGKYRGFVSALRVPDAASSQEGSSTSVSQKVDREVTIEVNGKEVVSFDVSIIPKRYDLQKDEILSIRLIYDNQGNVSITPEAQIRISPISNGSSTGEKSSQAVYNTIYPYPENQPAVKSGAIYEIPAIEIPTSNFAKGKYVADMSFMENGKVISEKKFVFSMDMFEAAALKTNSNFLGAIGPIGGINNNSIIPILAIMVMIGVILISYYKRFSSKKIDHEKS